MFNTRRVQTIPPRLWMQTSSKFSSRQSLPFSLTTSTWSRARITGAQKKLFTFLTTCHGSFPKEACQSDAVVVLNFFLSSSSLTPSLLCPLSLSICLGLCRLCRRMSRDYLFRGNSAARTLKMWGNVRRGEEKWIFPHQNHADYVINSAMEYEMPTLKSRWHSLTHALTLPWTP
jgi:hypothetical protein